MLTYALLAAYAAVGAWCIWMGLRGGARVGQGILVSLLWPLAIVLVLVLLLADHLPDDAVIRGFRGGFGSPFFIGGVRGGVWLAEPFAVRPQTSATA